LLFYSQTTNQLLEQTLPNYQYLMDQTTLNLKKDLNEEFQFFFQHYLFNQLFLFMEIILHEFRIFILQ